MITNLNSAIFQETTENNKNNFDEFRQISMFLKWDKEIIR